MERGPAVACPAQFIKLGSHPRYHGVDAHRCPPLKSCICWLFRRVPAAPRAGRRPAVPAA